jgi:hypothetical protein
MVTKSGLRHSRGPEFSPQSTCDLKPTAFVHGRQTHTLENRSLSTLQCGGQKTKLGELSIQSKKLETGSQSKAKKLEFLGKSKQIRK